MQTDTYYSNDTYYFITIIIVCVATIFIYGKYRCDHKDYKDPLQFHIYGDLDGWSLTHFTFYFLLGYFFPNYVYYSFILGVLWELFEDYSGKYEPKILDGWGFCSVHTDRQDGKWWYGKTTDILMNTLGLYVGYHIRQMKS